MIYKIKIKAHCAYVINILANNFYNVNRCPVINWKIAPITEDQKIPPNKMSKTKSTIPYCLKKFLAPCQEAGKKLNKIHEPSNGGIGIKLKIANQILISTITLKAINNPGFIKRIFSGINLNINPKTSAIAMLEAGPAAETFISPYFLSEKL